MKLGQFADIIGKDLNIKRYANQKKQFTCSFDSSDVLEGRVFHKVYGNGDSIESAIADYVQQVRGKKLVFNAMKEDSMECNVPETLEP